MVSRSSPLVGALVASILLLIVALAGGFVLPAFHPGSLGPALGSPLLDQAASGNFDQLVVVLMENKNLNEVYGPAPYMTQLADQYAFSEHWASITNPSQPNYIALLGGSTFGVSGDGNHPNLNHPTMVDIIENSSHTWKAFAEDASGSGCGINPPRGEDHFPFLSYTTITSDPARCANLLPGSSNEVIAAFNAGTNFIWLTPNDCNNMHSCSVSTGDQWIQSWVPNLLSAMAGKKAALIIMFDEAYTSPPYIYMGFSGPASKLGYKSTAEYNHYSLLKLLEDVWGGGSLGQGDVSAPSPVEFFNAGGPDFSLSANPSSVSFVAGQTATSAIALSSSGGFNGTVDLTADSSPAGVSASCVPASISGTETSTCTLSGSTAGSYAVTITGTNGSLRHTTSISVTVTTPASPDFSLSASPGTLSFAAGQSGSSTISLQSTGGFNGIVELTTTSNPAGITTTCSPSSLTDAGTSACTLSATASGSYTVSVTGTNGTLSHSTSIAVTVTASGPTARFTFSPVAPNVNDLISFDASSSSDTDPSTTLQARWDWEGDGIWDTPYSYALTSQHAFTAAGRYTVNLEVLDSNGLTDSASQSVPVLDLGGPDKTPPQIMITSPSNATIFESTNVTVTGIATDNVAIWTVELSTDNVSWRQISATTTWSGNVTLKEGRNTIYARATDTAGNRVTVVVTVIAEGANAVAPSSQNQALAAVLALSAMIGLVWFHVFLWDRKRELAKSKKKDNAEGTSMETSPEAIPDETTPGSSGDSLAGDAPEGDEITGRP